MRTNVIVYRTMAYITGVVLIFLCVIAILQAFINDSAAVNVVGTMHGGLYIVYVGVAFALSRRLRLTVTPTIVLLLAGTVPVMTFLVERHMAHAYIEPALAQEATGAPPAPQAVAQAGTPTAGEAPAAGAVPPR